MFRRLSQLTRILGLFTISAIGLWIVCFGIFLLFESLLDCSFNTNRVRSCLVGGLDLGFGVHVTGMMATWGQLILAPIVLLTGVLWAAMTLILRAWKR
jgi:hypothetical protein